MSTSCNGKNGIEFYIECNSGTKMLKAIAIRVFSTAVSSWGMGILEETQKAANMTGASVRSIRKVDSDVLFVHDWYCCRGNG